MWGELADLIVPRYCAGCGAAGAVLCRDCFDHVRQPPHLISPTTDVGVPVFSMGPYSEIRQRLIVAMKERGNTAARRALGPIFGAAVAYLQARGELGRSLVVVPAPTSPAHARARGGDHVTAIVAASGVPYVQAVRHRQGVRDSVGLGVHARRLNMAHAVEVVAPPQPVPVVLFDDIVTTGATLQATVRALILAGWQVEAAVTLANA